METHLPCPELQGILREALAPSPGITDKCRGYRRWDPEHGHIPRGCLGATGHRDEVRLVIIAAEPGDPHAEEKYPATATPGEYLQLFTAHAYNCFAHSRDRYHANVRCLLSACFPGLTFDEQLRRVWITESCLCSAEKEGGSIPVKVTRCCADRYLKKQLALFPDAVLAAFSTKAVRRSSQLGFRVLDFGALAPPGCNRKEGRESWEMVERAVKQLLDGGGDARSDVSDAGGRAGASADGGVGEGRREGCVSVPAGSNRDDEPHGGAGNMNSDAYVEMFRKMGFTDIQLRKTLKHVKPIPSLYFNRDGDAFVSFVGYVKDKASFPVNLWERIPPRKKKDDRPDVMTVVPKPGCERAAFEALLVYAGLNTEASR